MSERWVNIYPLMKPDGSNEGIISAWINSREVKTINLEKTDDKWKISIFFYTKQMLDQTFSNKLDALRMWENLKDSIGIKTRIKRGPKKKYYENLEGK